jgi:hypothetical protein
MELLRFEEERMHFLHPRHSQPANPKQGCGAKSPLHTGTA